MADKEPLNSDDDNKLNGRIVIPVNGVEINNSNGNSKEIHNNESSIRSDSKNNSALRKSFIMNGNKNTATANSSNGNLNDKNNMNGFSSSNQTQLSSLPSQNCNNDDDFKKNKEPPDGGVRGWTVMLSAFLCNGIIFGIINTYGVFQSYLQEQLKIKKDTASSSKAALVGSLTIGTTFFLSLVAGMLTDKIGLRLTTFIGGLLCSGGMLLSSFFSESIELLCLTYGVMFGAGAALAYTPTLAILGHYFKRYLGKVNGFVTAGSSIFTIILPPLLNYLVNDVNIQVTFQILSAISAFIILCSIVYKPLHPPPEPPKKKAGRSAFNMCMRSIVNVEIWQRKRYIIWAICIPLALFGYFVPYVHMKRFVEITYDMKIYDPNLPVMCIGISSGIGRIVFGTIADLPKVNRILLQQMSLIGIGVLTMLLPLTNSYYVLLSFALVMGVFDGCFITLIGPIAFEICGPQGASQAIGFLLGISSISLTIGPPLAGKIYDTTNSYTMPFLLAGIPPIIGALLMFLVRCVNDNVDNKNEFQLERDTTDLPLAKQNNWDEESKTEGHLHNGTSHLINSTGKLQNERKRSIGSSALVGSLTIGTTFFLSLVAGMLTDKIGLRLTTFIGGLLCSGGMLLSSFFSESIELLCLTYGVMFGAGAALAYTPTLAILGHYFKRYLGKVNGFVTAGSSIFTIILPPLLNYLVNDVNIQVTFQILSAISAFIILCSIVYKPLHPPPEPPKKKAGRSAFNMCMRSIVNVEIWQRKRYIIWAICIPLALFGYFVPYVHMKRFVEITYDMKIYDPNLPVMCIGISSGIGRIVFGTIADLPKVNRILLQQMSLIGIGVLTMLLPLTNSYYVLLSFALVMGVFDGCFITLIGPIAFEICGPQGASQAIGFLLGISSISLTIGPPLAGKIYDTTNSYTMPFLLAGIPPIIGALLMFLVRCVNDNVDNKNEFQLERDTTDLPLAKQNNWDEESKTEGHLHNGTSHLINSTGKLQNERKRSIGSSGINSSESALLLKHCNSMSSLVLMDSSTVDGFQLESNIGRRYTYSVF